MHQHSVLRRWLRLQLSVFTVFTLLTFALFGGAAAVYGCCGWCTFMLSQWVFGLVLKGKRCQQPTVSMQRLYAGVALKWVVAALTFVLVLALGPAKLGVFSLSFMASAMTHSMCLLLRFRGNHL